MPLQQRLMTAMIEAKLKNLIRAGITAQATFIVGLAVIPCQNPGSMGLTHVANPGALVSNPSDPFDTTLSFADLKELTQKEPTPNPMISASPTQKMQQRPKLRKDCASLAAEEPELNT